MYHLVAHQPFRESLPVRPVSDACNTMRSLPLTACYIIVLCTTLILRVLRSQEPDGLS